MLVNLIPARPTTLLLSLHSALLTSQTFPFAQPYPSLNNAPTIDTYNYVQRINIDFIIIKTLSFQKSIMIFATIQVKIEWFHI